MEFGIATVTHIGKDPAIVALAEELGYDAAWFCDSQMIYSDVYATMAVAAQYTSRIRLGTGVAVVRTRMAPIIAHSIATINQLAPGRVELGIGAGNTARLTMGFRPVKYSTMIRDIRAIRALLDGETTPLDEDGETHLARFLHQDHGFINLRDRIPITLSAMGPKGMAFSGAEMDGHMVFGMPAQGVEACRGIIDDAARNAGRDPADVPTKGIYPTTVLAPGETVTSPRVLDAVAPFAANVCHILMEWGERAEALLPGSGAIAEAYRAYVATLPKDAWYMTLHEGHLYYAREDDRKFLTPELANMAAVIGNPETMIERVHELETAGISQYILQVDYTDPERQLRDFAAQVMGPYRREN